MNLINKIIQVKIRQKYVAHLVLTEPQGERRHIIVAPILPQPNSKSLIVTIENQKHSIRLEALYSISLLQKEAEIELLDEEEYELPIETLKEKNKYLLDFTTKNIFICVALFPYDDKIEQKKRPVINIANTNFYITTKKKLNQNQIIINKSHLHFNITGLKQTSYIEIHRCMETKNENDKIIGNLPTDIKEEFKKRLLLLFEIR